MNVIGEFCEGGSMSNESSNVSLGLPMNMTAERPSMDDSISLNDDLANESEYGGSIASHPTIARLGSLRYSMDDSSSFSASQYNIFSPIENGQNFSPIGPNSIYELTVASDLLRVKQRRTKASVLLNGGLTSVNNLIIPTTNDIPPIHLSKLNNKVSNQKLIKNFVSGGINDEYKKFESSYNVLTQDVLNKLNQGFIDKKSKDSDIEDEDLTSIPEVFMKSDFNLDDPRIFNQVIENVAILPKEDNSSFTQTLANNTNLNEKFSNYLDMVELNLIKEISKSSDSFFTTISDITKIKQQSDNLLTQYDNTTKKLNDLKKNQIDQGKSILKKMITKKNVLSFESSLLQLNYVVKIFKLANISFNNGKYDKCMNEVVLLESLIYGTDIKDTSLSLPLSQPLQDLSNLPALVHIINDLGNLKTDCGKGFINEFVNLLIDDLRSHYQYIPTQTTFNRLYIASDINRKYPATDPNYKFYQTIDPKVKSKLTGLISNLVKSDHILQAYSAYQDRLIIEIKEIIKHNIPSSSSAGLTQHDDYSLADISQASSRASSAPPSDNQGKNQGNGPQNLSTSIKSLSPREFESMLKTTYANLSECLRCLTSHQKLLLDLALTYIPADKSFDVIALDITSAINKAIELTQIRLTKVINVRLEQIADLPVPFYLSLYAISSAYLQECESINPGYASTTAGSTLSEWFKHHINYFIHRVHLKALKSMVANVDKEIWREVTDAEVLNEKQVLLDEIIRFSENTNSTITNFVNELWFSMLDFYEGDGKVVPVVSVSQDSSKLSLLIKEELFLVPNLILQALSHLKDYLIVFKMFPNHAFTIENNLLNYFKFMNSKISQSVLNAGATRTAGLRHITTKNIALCIQTIEYNILLLPYLQTIFNTRSTPQPQSNSQSLDELTFSRVMSNYKDHENELFAKLVAIMYDRTVNHSAAALKIDWSQPLPRQQQCHPYMEALVKETLTITKVLTKYLPQIKCSLILLQIFDNYKKSFVTCYCVDLPQPKDMIEKQMILKDIDYFRSQLCDLPGYGNSGQVIWENVHSLPTQEDSEMEQKLKDQEEAMLRSKEIEAKEKLPIQELKPPESKDKLNDTLFEIPKTEDGGFESNIQRHDVQNIDPEDSIATENQKLDKEIMKQIENQETSSEVVPSNMLSNQADNMSMNNNTSEPGPGIESSEQVKEGSNIEEKESSKSEFVTQIENVDTEDCKFVRSTDQDADASTENDLEAQSKKAMVETVEETPDSNVQNEFEQVKDHSGSSGAESTNVGAQDTDSNKDEPKPILGDLGQTQRNFVELNYVPEFKESSKEETKLEATEILKSLIDDIDSKTPMSNIQNEKDSVTEKAVVQESMDKNIPQDKEEANDNPNDQKKLLPDQFKSSQDDEKENGIDTDEENGISNENLIPEAKSETTNKNKNAKKATKKKKKKKKK